MIYPLAAVFLGLLSFPPFGFYPAAFLFLAPIFGFILKEARFWRIAVGIMIFRFLYALGLTYFVFEPVLYFHSLVIFSFWLVIIFSLKKFFSPPRSLKEEGAVLAILALSYLFFDYLEARFSFLPTFIMAAGGALADSPFLGLAAGGFVGLGLLVVAVNALLLLAWKWREAKIFVLAALILSAAFALSQIFLLKRAVEYQNRNKALELAIVSVNSDFDREMESAGRAWNGDLLNEEQSFLASSFVRDKFGDLKNDFSGQNPDLMIFPEDFIDVEFWGEADPEAYRKFGITNAAPIISAYRDLAARLKTNVVADLTTIRESGRYNTTILFNRNGAIEGIYDKVDLAFGGERWPFGGWQPFYYRWLRRIRPEYFAFSPIFNPRYRYQSGGDESKIFDTDELGKFAAPICLEIHYPRRNGLFVDRGAEFLINSSSNNWVFGPGLRKYLDLAVNLRRIEAVRLGVPIIVTGRRDYAGIVYPDGASDLVDFQSPKGYNIFKGRLRIDR